MDEVLKSRVSAHLARAAGAPVEITTLEPLAGGACQDNWRVVLADGRKLVLRSDAKTSITGSLTREVEGRVIEAAAAAGVRTPPPRWPGRGILRDGAFAYFLDWVSGEAIGRRVVKSPELARARERLPEELAREAARIHAITPATHPELFAGSDRLFDRDPATLDPVGSALEHLRSVLDRHPPRPALELAARWLTDEKPKQSRTTLVHGDFRVGNFLVGPEGLQAVLDWEFSRWGTPAEDLAWIAVRDWRFGRLDKPIGGLCKREPFYAAYERASGSKLDRKELHYWEVLGNVRWAVGSLDQGLRYTTGDRDLELIAVARRAAEMEYEALRLIDRGPA